jgi:hypothetical protein
VDAQDSQERTLLEWRVESPVDDAGRPHSIESYMETLRNDGWTSIGRPGGFARVFERNGMVTKVFRKDPAYLSYVRHVVGASKNRALPQISEIIEIVGHDERFHHVVLERLNDFCPHLTRGDVTLEEIRDFAYHFAIAESSAPGSFTFNDAYQTIYDAMTDDEKTALADIIRIAQTQGWRADLETWNVMLRGEDIVFVDPLLILHGELGFPSNGITRISEPLPGKGAKRVSKRRKKRNTGRRQATRAT